MIDFTIWHFESQSLQLNTHLLCPVHDRFNPAYKVNANLLASIHATDNTLSRQFKACLAYNVTLFNTAIKTISLKKLSNGQWCLSY